MDFFLRMKIFLRLSHLYDSSTDLKIWVNVIKSITIDDALEEDIFVEELGIESKIAITLDGPPDPSLPL